MPSDGCGVIDAVGRYVMPGGVDEHVHMGSLATLGFETFHAVVVGGTTTIVDFAPWIKGKGIIESIQLQDENYAKGVSTSDYSFHGMFMDTSEELLKEIFKMVGNGVATLNFYGVQVYASYGG